MCGSNRNVQRVLDKLDVQLAERKQARELKQRLLAILDAASTTTARQQASAEVRAAFVAQDELDNATDALIREALTNGSPEGRRFADANAAVEEAQSRVLTAKAIVDADDNASLDTSEGEAIEPARLLN